MVLEEVDCLKANFWFYLQRAADSGLLNRECIKRENIMSLTEYLLISIKWMAKSTKRIYTFVVVFMHIEHNLVEQAVVILLRNECPQFFGCIGIIKILIHRL